MKNKILIISFLMLGLMSCEVEDPFVARVVSPVLVAVIGSDGIPSNGMTTEPTVTAPVAADAQLKVKVMELDKTGILDYKVGIDSIPVKGLKLAFKLRSGTLIKEVQTDDSGVASFSSTWASLGISTPKAGSSVKLTATGTYKDVQFSKYFILSGK
ncbi:MAG: hypothetical protein U0V04_17020 [Spirosomataceae bacterium]|jgi:hypothetical protein|nr:hypothetical protein [Bacteroidota bacterium]